MARNVRPEPLVELDLNSPVFQTAWSNLELAEQEKAFAFKVQGLHFECFSISLGLSSSLDGPTPPAK